MLKTLLFGALFAPAAAAQQVPVDALASPAASSPVLGRDHWAVRAAERLNMLGLVTDYLPAQRSVTRRIVYRAIQEAEVRSKVEMPSLTALTHAWRERFLEEFPESEDRFEERSVRGVLLGSKVQAGYGEYAGRVEPGLAPNWEYTTPVLPLPDEGGPEVMVSVAAAPSQFLSAAAEPGYGRAGLTLGNWDVRALLGGLAFSVGRQAVGYGSAHGGAVVLSGVASWDVAQVETEQPFHLPGWFRHIGPIAFHTFATRFSEARHAGDPYFWGARLVLQPHPRLTLAGQRAAIFGGDSVDVPTTPRSILEMLIGVTERQTNSFDNQLASVEVRFRAPTDAFLPVTLYGEVAMEDLDVLRGLRDSPGFVVGLAVPALPGAPEVGIGLERAHFAKACGACGTGNPPWYRHWSFQGGWAVTEGPIGHPLGGHGSETLMFAHADLFEANVRLAGQAFVRERGRENLYVPGRKGRSTGFRGRAFWRLGPRSEVSLAMSRESGQGWKEHEARAGIQVFF